MKKILILSDLSFWPCVTCALIRLTPLKDSEIKFKFSPKEDFLKALRRAVENYDILIGIGYEQMEISKDLFAFGEKLLILSTPEDKEEFIPFFFAREFQKENLDLMTAIIEIANGQIDQSLLIDYDPEELENILNPSEPNLDEYFAETKERYDRAFKVIHSVYPEEDEVKFHKNFFLEIVDGENIEWIEEALKKYEPMENETKELIQRLHPCEKIPSLGLVSAQDHRFFEDDVLNILENSQYITIAIEYKDVNGDYVTIRAERCSDEMNYFTGKIEENWSEVIASLN